MHNAAVEVICELRYVELAREPIYRHIYMHACLPSNIDACTHASIHNTHIHIYIHTHIHACMHAHIPTCMHAHIPRYTEAPSGLGFCPFSCATNFGVIPDGCSPGLPLFTCRGSHYDCPNGAAFSFFLDTCTIGCELVAKCVSTIDAELNSQDSVMASTLTEELSATAAKSVACICK